MAGNNDDRLLCDGVRMLIVAYRQGILNGLDEAGIWARMAMVSPLEEAATEGLIAAIFGAETLRHRVPTTRADPGALADLLEAGGVSAQVALAIAERVIATHQELSALAANSSTVATALATRTPPIPATVEERRTECLGTLILLTVYLRFRLARAPVGVTMHAMQSAAYQHLPPRQAPWVFAMLRRGIIDMGRLWEEAQTHANATRQSFWDVRQTDGFRQWATATLVARGFEPIDAQLLRDQLKFIEDCIGLEHVWEEELRRNGPQADLIRATGLTMQKMATPFVLRYCDLTVHGEPADMVLQKEYARFLPPGKTLVFEKLCYAARMTMRVVEEQGWPALRQDGETFALALKVNGVDPLVANTLGADLRTLMPALTSQLAYAAAHGDGRAPLAPPDRMKPEIPRGTGCFGTLALGLGIGLLGLAGLAGAMRLVGAWAWA